MLGTITLTSSKPAADLNYACTLISPGKVQIQDIDMPVCGPDQVLIRVEATGICGSDVNFCKNGGIGPYVLEKGKSLVLGHESAGTVVELGRNAARINPRLHIGDRVAIEPGVPCRRCFYCKKGQANLCDHLQYCGMPPTNGTLCQYYATDADLVVKIPTSMSLVQAGCIQPIAIALHIAEQGRFQSGKTLAVIGCGPLGLLIMAIARAYGMTCIVGIDRTHHRAEFAKSYAATATFTMDDNFSAPTIVEHMDLPTNGFDIVVEASGTDAACQAGVALTRRGGTYVQAGLGKTATSNFPMILVATKELTVVGSMRYLAGDFNKAIELVSKGLIDLTPLISKTFPLNRIDDAFQAASGGQCGKIVIMNQQMA